MKSTGGISAAAAASDPIPNENSSKDFNGLEWEKTDS